MTASSVAATANAEDIPCGQTTGTISINSTKGSSPFTYSIDGINFQGSNVFNNLPAGPYTFKIKDNKGCTAAVPAVLKSQNTPVLKLTNPSPSCSPINITTPEITAGSDAALSYSYWNNANATNALSNPASIPASGTYYIKGVTASGCFDIKPVSVIISASPVLQITDPVIGCEPATVDITSSSITTGSDAGLSYSYWNDAIGSQLLSNPNSISQAGTYFVSAKNTEGCVTIKPVMVIIVKKIEGIQYPFVTALPNVPLALQSRTIGANYSYEWFPPDGLNFSSIKNPIYQHDKSTEYKITMTSEVGCITIDTLLVKIDPVAGIRPDVLVPKAWSPNGDGHNDYLFPLIINIKELKYFRVFNRWGQLMFEAKGRLKGWNGIFNGKTQPMDVYSWDAEAIGVDGQIIKRSGNVVLLR